MRTLLTLSLTTLMGSLSGCCDCPNAAGPPPPIGVQGSGGGEQTSPSPTPQPPAASGIDEGAAVNIALQRTEQEGYDPAAYDDVVVEDAGDHWVVQLRRPMVNTFLEIRVDKRSGAAELRTASMN